jgi:septal ring factor EnvC (AmiA/AmiB activator)
MRHYIFVYHLPQKVAKARKQALAQQMKSKLDRHSVDQSELELILKKQGGELSRSKTQLSQMDFDLKEARFEINQILAREAALKDEKRVMVAKSAETIAGLRAQLEAKELTHEERTAVALFECDKMIKTLACLYKAVFDGRSSSVTTPKTTKQLLDRATRDADHLRSFLHSKSSALLSEEQEHVLSMKQQKRPSSVRYDFTTVTRK